MLYSILQSVLQYVTKISSKFLKSLVEIKGVKAKWPGVVDFYPQDVGFRANCSTTLCFSSSCNGYNIIYQTVLFIMILDDIC